MNILGLPFWQVLDVSETTHDMQIGARCEVQPSACPHCGCVANLYRHGVKQQRFMDLPIRAKVVLGTGLKAQKRPRFGDGWKAEGRVAEAPATYIQGELEFPSPQEQSWDNLIFLCVTHHSQDHVSGFHTEAFSISDLFSTGESE